MFRYTHLLFLSAFLTICLTACSVSLPQLTTPGMPPPAVDMQSETAVEIQIERFQLIAAGASTVLLPATEGFESLASAWQQLPAEISGRARTFYDAERFASEIEPLPRIEAALVQPTLLLPDDPQPASRLVLTHTGGEWILLAQRGSDWQPYLFSNTEAAEAAAAAAEDAGLSWE